MRASGIRHWRSGIGGLGITALLVLGGAAQALKPTPEVRAILAPTGELRVGLFLGNPSSLVQSASGERTGVAFELGREFAAWLGVPFAPVVFPNNGALVDGVRAGQVDVVFINATPARAKEIDFTQPYLEVEAGYLLRPGSPIRAVADVDTPGVQVGVMEGSTSSTTLPGVLKRAELVRVPTIEKVREMLSQGALDAFATNKSILFEIADTLPGSRVLDGYYTVEQLSLGIPKGRERGLPYARSFVAAALARGLVKAAVARAGLRGARVNGRQE